MTFPHPSGPGGRESSPGVPVRLMVGAINLYRLAVSPVLPPSCRYWPSCSEYAIEAIRGHGPLRGGWLAARRLCRCHPWAAGGIDLPPPSPSAPSSASPRAASAVSSPDHEPSGRRSPACRRHTLDSHAS